VNPIVERVLHGFSERLTCSLDNPCEPAKITLRCANYFSKPFAVKIILIIIQVVTVFSQAWFGGFDQVAAGSACRSRGIGK
jgi:hypothetical protein